MCMKTAVRGLVTQNLRDDSQITPVLQKKIPITKANYRRRQKETIKKKKKKRKEKKVSLTRKGLEKMTAMSLFSIFAPKNTEDNRTVRQMGTIGARRVAAPGKSKQKI